MSIGDGKTYSSEVIRDRGSVVGYAGKVTQLSHLVF